MSSAFLEPGDYDLRECEPGLFYNWDLSEDELELADAMAPRCLEGGCPSVERLWEVENYQPIAQMVRELAMQCPQLKLFEWYPAKDSANPTQNNPIWVWTVTRRKCRWAGKVVVSVSGELVWKGGPVSTGVAVAREMEWLREQDS